MKNLICINTYNSVDLIKALVWDYIDFVQNNPTYDFLVSLDGSDSETIEYCQKYKIPILYSEKNEGVGISKNRVMESLPDYDHYFFIEDDIELLNSEVFDIHIKLSKKYNIHHFSLFEACRIGEQKGVLKKGDYHIIESMYGSAQFNFFTKEGLNTVGGFHTCFAKYKRFGHTEHTYRFVNNNLSKYPFQVIKECLDGYFRWNDPISRIKIKVEVSSNRLFVEEEELIKEKLAYFPIRTLSPYTILNKENISICSDMKYDQKMPINKRIFYFKLWMLNYLRSIKKILRRVLIK